MLGTVGTKILVQPAEVNSNQKILVVNGKPTRFLVTHIGNEVDQVKVGDQVYLDKFAGQEITYEAENFLVVDEKNILAKISSDESCSECSNEKFACCCIPID